MSKPFNPTSAPPKHVLTLDELLAPGELKEVDIPELGGVVYVRAASAATVIEFMERRSTELSLKNMAKVIAAAVVDNKGTPYFADDQAAERLYAVRMDVFNRIGEAVLGALGMTLPGGTFTPTPATEVVASATNVEPKGPVTTVDLLPAAQSSENGEGSGAADHPLSAASGPAHSGASPSS